MRVIAGTARSIPLKSPKDKDIRPTMDRVREACFSILHPRIAGSRFLDLFAGTGANGIEALSRGAAHCVFVEANPDSIHILESNLHTTKLWGCSAIIRGRIPDILGVVAREHGAFDLVYADPPFQVADYPELLDWAAGHALLSGGGLLIVEHPARIALPSTAPGPLQQTSRRRYGDVALTFYENPAPAAAP